MLWRHVSEPSSSHWYSSLLNIVKLIAEKNNFSFIKGRCTVRQLIRNTSYLVLKKICLMMISSFNNVFELTIFAWRWAWKKTVFLNLLIINNLAVNAHNVSKIWEVMFGHFVNSYLSISKVQVSLVSIYELWNANYIDWKLL